MKEVALITYMGGPSTLEEVKPFLTNLFSDRDLIDFKVPSPVQKFLAGLIASFRAKKVKEQYKLIGGGSPLVKQTIEQAEQVEKLTGIKTFVGMIYSKPFLKDVAKEIKRINPEKIAVITMYPQYSIATTEPCIRDVKSLLGDFKLKIVKSWCKNKNYINWIKKQIVRELKNCSSPYILFSAHSLPEYTLKTGDIYTKEIKETVNLVMKDIPNVPFGISYQSKVGPIKWIEPSTESSILNIAKKGVNELVIFPVSFVSEHIETLYEIDIEYKKLSMNAGIKVFKRVKLNHVDKDLIKAISDEITNVI